MSKVIVVGGGPAGMFAAIAAAERGHEVVLLEKNEKLGKMCIRDSYRCGFRICMAGRKGRHDGCGSCSKDHVRGCICG